MASSVGQQKLSGKKMTKQLTGKRGDTEFHSVVRGGNLELALEIINGCVEGELVELMSKQNQSAETALYVAAEYGHVELVKEMSKYYDIGSASIKARNGYDAFHVAAKQGDFEMVKVILEVFPQLSVTFDQSNSTALHTAAAQGHINVVNFLLETNSSLATIPKNNGKTALHSSARNGHVAVVKALLSKEEGILNWRDKKGQTAFHMAVKGQSVDVVNELIQSDPSLATIIDGKGNTALHIATRKGRVEIVQALVKDKRMKWDVINKSGETALDIAEKGRQSEIATILKEHGILSAKNMKLVLPTRSAKELKQTVSDIKHDVHNQLEHTFQTQKRVKNIAKRLNKMHLEGLNNAINSTTVVAVLIATVAFAAIFNLPGQYVDNREHIPPGYLLGEGNIAPQLPFAIFFIFDSLALFISLAVVVVQTSIVVVERRAKKQMMSIINKLMWLACAFVSVAFLALSYIVVGKEERWMATAVTFMGTFIMVTTLGTLCYWVVMHRIESSNLRSLRKSARSSKSLSRSISIMSESEIADDEYKKLYAI
ncbi:ankyrin repeat-containing protein At5g02620-like [Nicotiana tomentosiformis]|uniref:ankyrin repeat-containing protein At5g02620-like n=1 Tax=Nicotiana tomentosiformis TaxID=4098 RepID=UPI00051B8119|nr:ankyrin repeat-containing protein At5g02620-like [Nicotiana tomentosiformis]